MHIRTYICRNKLSKEGERENQGDAQDIRCTCMCVLLHIYVSLNHICILRYADVQDIIFTKYYLECIFPCFSFGWQNGKTILQLPL